MAQTESKHAYNAHGISPRQFLIEVMRDETVDLDLRTDAALKLQQFFPEPEFPEDRRPLSDFQHPQPEPKPRSKSRRSRPKAREHISRDDWAYYKSLHEYGAPVQQMRDRVLINSHI